MPNKITDNEIKEFVNQMRKNTVKNEQGYIVCDDELWESIVKLIEHNLDLINRQKAENLNLTSDLTSLKTDLTSAKAEVERLEQSLKEAHLDIKEHLAEIKMLAKAYSVYEETSGLMQAKAEAVKEFAEKLCKDRVSNDPVVIAVKVELNEMVSEKE